MTLYPMYQPHCKDKNITIVTAVRIILGILFLFTLQLIDNSLKLHHTPDENLSPPTATASSLTTTNRHLTNTNEQNPSAVVALVPSNKGDLDDLCLALRSLSHQTIIPPQTPILIFHDNIDHGFFDQQTKQTIIDCTPNPLSFHGVNFTFPPELHNYFYQSPILRKEFERMERFGTDKGRGNWGYIQMIRFWTTLLWRQPIIQSFDTLMRIDSDSCFVAPPTAEHDAILPSLPHPHAVYRAKGPGIGSNVYVTNLFDFVGSYVVRGGIRPSNPELWDLLQSIWNEKQTLPVLQTNLEVMRREFFERDDVRRWQEALTEREPFGVWRWRWGDAQTRVMTLAMFAREEEVVFVEYKGYKHGRGKCADYFGLESSW